MDNTLTLSAGGVTVVVAPLGFRDMRRVPQMWDALVRMPVETPEDLAAYGAAWDALADLVDSYAAGPVPPSRVPGGDMADLLVRWVSGVGDAAVPPASGASTPSAHSTPPAGIPSPSPES